MRNRRQLRGAFTWIGCRLPYSKSILRFSAWQRSSLSVLRGSERELSRQYLRRHPLRRLTGLRWDEMT